MTRVLNNHFNQEHDSGKALVKMEECKMWGGGGEDPYRSCSFLGCLGLWRCQKRDLFHLNGSAGLSCSSIELRTDNSKDMMQMECTITAHVVSEL